MVQGTLSWNDYILIVMIWTCCVVRGVCSKWTLNRTQFPRIPWFVIPRCKDPETQLWAHDSNRVTDQIIKTPAPSYVLAILHFCPQGPACPQVIFSWIILGPTTADSCISSRPREPLFLIAATQGPASIPAQFAPAATTQSLQANYTIQGRQSKLPSSFYPPAPFLQRLVSLNWA